MANDIVSAMRLVQGDAAHDAVKVDSTPFTPRGVGEQLGAIYAMISAIARAVELLAAKEAA